MTTVNSGLKGLTSENCSVARIPFFHFQIEPREENARTAASNAREPGDPEENHGEEAGVQQRGVGGGLAAEPGVHGEHSEIP